MALEETAQLHLRHFRVAQVGWITEAVARIPLIDSTCQLILHEEHASLPPAPSTHPTLVPLSVLFLDEMQTRSLPKLLDIHLYFLTQIMPLQMVARIMNIRLLRPTL